MGVTIYSPNIDISSGPKYPCIAPTNVPKSVPPMRPLNVTPSPIHLTPLESLFPKSTGIPPPNINPPLLDRYAGSKKYRVVTHIMPNIDRSRFISYLLHLNLLLIYSIII